MAKRLGILLLFGAAALLAISAYWLLFTTFMAYDDEGYILVSLKNYSEHGGLYAHVYSQYGPFFYLLHDAGHRLLHYAFTNTSGRFVTLACWMSTAIICALLVWQQTRAILLTFFTFALTFFYLSLMVREPVHPGGIIAVLIALGACGGAKFIDCNSMRGLATMSGLIGACLVLTKINVGVFFLTAAGTWFVVNLHHSNHARIGLIVAAILLFLLPLCLMREELTENWCRIFALLSVIANSTMLVICWHDRQNLTGWRNAGWGGATLGLFGSAILAAVCLRGTTFSEMIEGILLGPLRHPGVYHFAPNWRPGVVVSAIASLGLVSLAGGKKWDKLPWLLLGLRFLLIVEICLGSAEWLPLTGHSSVMTYAVPFAWIFVFRLSRGKTTPCAQGCESWIGLILVLQFLHAYPVAGSQIAWGTFLIVPLMALGIRDSQLFLQERGHSVVAIVAGIGACVFAALPAARISATGWRNYRASQPLLLSGAENVRPPEAFAGTLRVISLNASAYGDMLFSLPGMFSFNEWTHLPTPTLENTTHWFSLLNTAQQQEICEALGRAQRPVLVVQKGMLDFLKENNFPISSPLSEYLENNFTTAFVLDDYEFQVRRGRAITPVDIATLESHQSFPSLSTGYNIEMTVAIPKGRRISQIELVTLEDSPRTLFLWDKTSGALRSLPIDPRDTPITAENESAWGQSLPAIARLKLHLHAWPTIDRKNSVLYLRDDSGRLAEVRFTD